jgi:hypothetical protein
MAVTPVVAGNFANASRTQIIFTIPGTATTDDEIIFQINQDGSGSAPSTPGGWAQVAGSPITSGGASRHSCYIYKVQASDVPGTTTYTFSWISSDFSSAGYEVFRGADVTTPQDAAAKNATFNGAGPLVLPSITTVTDNAMLVMTEGEQGVGATHTGPGNERVDIDGNSLYDQVLTPAGASGTKSITVSGSSAGGGFLVALRPAATQAPAVEPSMRLFPKFLVRS